MTLLGLRQNLFNCPASSTTGPEAWRTPADMDCIGGCLGTDGVMGTRDDTIQPGECEHSVDQGAICYTATDPIDAIMVQRCGSGGDQCHMSGRCDQGIVFGANCFNFPRPAVAFLTRFCRVLTQFGLIVANPATGCIDYYTTNW